MPASTIRTLQVPDAPAMRSYGQPTVATDEQRVRRLTRSCIGTAQTAASFACSRRSRAACAGERRSIRLRSGQSRDNTAAVLFLDQCAVQRRQSQDCEKAAWSATTVETRAVRVLTADPGRAPGPTDQTCYASDEDRRCRSVRRIRHGLQGEPRA